MSLEMHMRTRGDLRPDPEFDPICAAFYYITNDVPDGDIDKTYTGVIILDRESASMCAVYDQQTGASGSLAPHMQTLLQKSGIPSLHVQYVSTEEKLIEEVVAIIHRWVEYIYF